jgi:hypothetical protein
MLRDIARAFAVLTLASTVVVGFGAIGLLSGVALHAIRVEDLIDPLEKVASAGNAMFYGPGMAGFAALIRGAGPRIARGIDAMVLRYLDRLTAPAPEQK